MKFVLNLLLMAKFWIQCLNKDCILSSKNKSIINVKDILNEAGKKYFVTIETQIIKQRV